MTIFVDYTGFVNFPFPSGFGTTEDEVERFFYALADEEQLRLLGGCESFDTFHARVRREMEKR